MYKIIKLKQDRFGVTQPEHYSSDLLYKRMKLSEASVFTEPRLEVLRGVSGSVVENV